MNDRHSKTGTLVSKDDPLSSETRGSGLSGTNALARPSHPAISHRRVDPSSEDFAPPTKPTDQAHRRHPTRRSTREESRPARSRKSTCAGALVDAAHAERVPPFDFCASIHALFDAVCEQELEGVVAKRLNEPYRPGERAWVKTKNREYWRYEIEREGALKINRPRQFV